MGDYTPRSSIAENSDDAVLSGNIPWAKKMKQGPVGELPKMNESDSGVLAQLEASQGDDENVAPGYENGPRQKTGGRQKGTPNKVARIDIAKAARIYSLRALEVIIDVMQDEEESGATRLAAANALLDRAHGKAKQTTEHTGLDGGDIQTKLTIEFVGQPPVRATVDAQLTDNRGEVVDVELNTVRVPESRRPWEPQ